MAKEMIFNGDITEEGKEKLKETLKFLDTELAETFKMRYKNSEYELKVKVTATQIIVNVKRI